MGHLYSFKYAERWLRVRPAQGGSSLRCACGPHVLGYESLKSRCQIRDRRRLHRAELPLTLANWLRLLTDTVRDEGTAARHDHHQHIFGD